MRADHTSSPVGRSRCASRSMTFPLAVYSRSLAFWVSCSMPPPRLFPCQPLWQCQVCLSLPPTLVAPVLAFFGCPTRRSLAIVFYNITLAQTTSVTIMSSSVKSDVDHAPMPVTITLTLVFAFFTGHNIVGTLNRTLEGAIIVSRGLIIGLESIPQFIVTLSWVKPFKLLPFESIVSVLAVEATSQSTRTQITLDYHTGLYTYYGYKYELCSSILLLENVRLLTFWTLSLERLLSHYGQEWSISTTYQWLVHSLLF